MLGSDLLEIAIGLVFLYLLLATFCSTVMELIFGLIGLRARQLDDLLGRILSDGTLQSALKNQAAAATASPTNWLRDRFDQHPLIRVLRPEKPGWFKRGINAPSYIPSRTFAAALLDIARDASAQLPTPAAPAPAAPPAVLPASAQVDAALAEAKQTISLLPPESSLRRLLISLMETSQGQFQTFNANVEKWFDDAMDRLSGVYKRWAQFWMLLIALILAAVLNADTVDIVKRLAGDRTLREAIVASADTYVKEEGKAAVAQQPSEVKNPFEDLSEEINTIGFPIGWDEKNVPKDCCGIFLKIVGILLTGAAVSLGAPFWFDLLNKLVNLRASGAKPDKAKPQQSLR